MKTILTTMVLGLALAYQAGATLVTFDNLSDGGGGTQIANGYSGLNWNNFYVLDTALFGATSGYMAGTVSGNNVAYNAYGTAAAISSSAFNLTSAYLTAAWYDNLHVEVVGKLGSTILYDNTYTLSATAPSLINFNYNGIDSVQSISSGGTQNQGYVGSGTQFAMDDLVINGTAAVPEPSTYFAGAMLLLPFGIGAIRKLRKA